MQLFNKAVTVLASGVLLSAAVNAQPVQSKDKYNFVDVRYVADADFNNAGIDADGFRFGGSFRINKQVYAAGEWETVDFDDSDVDLDILRLGAGYIRPLNQQFDLNAEVQLIRAKFDWGLDDDTENGWSISGGVRGMATREIQVRAMLIFEDIENRDAYVTLGADYFFQANVSAGVEMDVSGDYETFSIGARVYF